MEVAKIKRDDLIYPDFCYKIVGVLFDVYNKLGNGHQEKTYQNAVSEGLKNQGFNFREQVYSPVEYLGKKVGRSYFDFLIEDKIVLELKKGDKFAKAHIDQVYAYLVSRNLKLGILAYFSPRNVHYKRIINIDSYISKN